jgi:hypothetical protein
MTDQLAVLGGSAVVVALMIGVAAVLGFRQTARIELAELERLLAASEPGARIAEAAIGADGRAALARLADGRVLAAKAMGDGVSLRSYPASAVRVTLGDGRVRAAFADLGFPTLDMKLDNAPRWLADLALSAGEQL